MKIYLVAIVLCLIPLIKLQAQHLYQVPKPPMDKSKLDSIIGEVKNSKVSRSLNIVWVYGYDKHHIAGAHDYVKVKDSIVYLLNQMSDVKVEEAFEFPNQSQLDRADLLIMYLHLPELKGKHFKALKAYVHKGGGLISLHETAIIRPASKSRKLAECLGLAWKEGQSKWGALFDKIRINNQHPIFKGFENEIYIPDEFYWDLCLKNDIEILGSVRTGPDGDSSGPFPSSVLSVEFSPVFWTYNLGQGKVFGTTTGHHTFTYFDPEFRIILFRAMAWVLDEKQDPFMYLVFKGITRGNKVGILEDMRGWKGKIRQ